MNSNRPSPAGADPAAAEPAAIVDALDSKAHKLRTPCGDGTDCAAGFIFVKSGSGDQCVKLCKTNEFNSCTDGRVCREVDVTGSGWGGCE